MKATSDMAIAVDWEAKQQLKQTNKLYSCIFENGFSFTSLVDKVFLIGNNGHLGAAGRWLSVKSATAEWFGAESIRLIL